jgi:hypothetical protein
MNRKSAYSRLCSLYAGALVCSLVAFYGCDTSLIPNDNTLKEGALTADFSNGTQYTSSSAKAKLQSGNVLISSAQDIIGALPDEIYLVFTPKSGSSFTISADSDPATLIEYCQTTSSACNQYYGRFGQGSATISVTSITRDASGNPLTLAGTFTGRLIQRGVSDSVRTVTSGSFNVRVQ